MTPEAEIAALKVEVVYLKESVSALTEKVEELLSAVNHARGGWLVLVPVSAFVGGLVTWFIQWAHK